MFEITGRDISALSDGDLRTLVARLALAELRAQGCPLSSVTAGGNQDAADGGIDVRVECAGNLTNPDFVPRAITGFQVKKPDMPPSAILSEMRLKGELRPAIAALAEASGAYIIVSAQGSVADKPLANRRKAIRDALYDLDAADALYSDFYDRDRMATWANEYPGIAAWVRGKVGLALAGWSSIGDWAGTKVAEPETYQFSDTACITDDRSRNFEQLTIAEGIARIRSALRSPKQCIRLIGLSGTGKTRLVQALFESGVGDEPLDPSLAVYTDYSVETDPTARDMARQLVMGGQRAILIIDNCNPAIHSELARICSERSSKVSLITVEYDVQEDEPEWTEVFRLDATSVEVLTRWLDEAFPGISQIDRRTIADFSGGNFRVARALAETVGKGETLGKLKSRDLFERIFQQRNEPDRDLLAAAQDLSLLYSIDGEETSNEGELGRVALIRQIEPAQLFSALVTLRRRGIVQARGRWRAILPHAIANPLAALALERIPSADFDRFCASLTPRMQKSLSRRLGYLHDSIDAQMAVARWLRDDGPLGDLISMGDDGLDIIANVAPVVPEAVLSKIESELDGLNGSQFSAPNSPSRWRWIRLIKVLSYEPHMFERAALLLARFLAAEPAEHNINSARDAFAELFHLHLSGTRATPEQRRVVVRRLAATEDDSIRRCASIALDALFTAHYFSSSSSFEFGARTRDWGWHPRTTVEIHDWYNSALALALELSTVLHDVRDIVARSVRDLWLVRGCHEALDRLATTFVNEGPWIEGWISFRTALRFEGKDMPEDVTSDLKAIIERLKPTDLLHQARAVVLNRAGGGWDVADGEADDGSAMRSWQRAAEMAKDIGRSLAHDDDTRKAFLPELFRERHAHRAYECGRGLAESADDLPVMWREMVDEFASVTAVQRNSTTLGGFMYEAHRRDPAFGDSALESAVYDCDLAPHLPYLQARVGVDREGVARLRRAVRERIVSAGDFVAIANGRTVESPPDELAALLLDIAGMAEGPEIALDILHMHFYREADEGQLHSPTLIDVGRRLLERADFSKKGVLRDFGLHTVIRSCCAGTDGMATARTICANIRNQNRSTYLSAHDLRHVLKALFETQPVAALDVFLLPNPSGEECGLIDPDVGFGTPIDEVDPEIARQWANRDADSRYPLLARAMTMFRGQSGQEDNEMSPQFLETMEYAPDKFAFLGDLWSRIHPRSWSGSLADILVQRRAQVLRLRDSSHSDVVRWVDSVLPELDRWIEFERARDRADEESFE